VDSDGDEVDDDDYNDNYHPPDYAAADVDDDANSTGPISYYVWYAVDIDVSPAEPHDSLTVQCPCLVSCSCTSNSSTLLPVFSRPYWVVRSRLWYDVLSVYHLSVCNVWLNGTP